MPMIAVRLATDRLGRARARVFGVLIVILRRSGSNGLRGGGRGHDRRELSRRSFRGDRRTRGFTVPVEGQQE